jgi:glycosyltransferase involved in cell wall biosynthesis
VRISIVTPSFNLGRYLDETMASVLGNLVPGDEYFVIDGGSTDGSAEIIRRHEGRLAGCVSEPDRGYADALAKGFARATGDILCWINAGDLLLAGALDAAREAMADTGADMIFGDDFYIDEDSRVILFSRGYVRDLRRAMLFGGWTPLQDACFWRRSLYERVGGLDPGLQYAADYDLFLRMALAGRTEYVPIAFSAFRRHPGQKSISGAPRYRVERQQVRARELARAAGPAWAKWLARGGQAVAVRWRVRVSQKRWVRPDLTGRRIDDVPSGAYWPPESASA